MPIHQQQQEARSKGRRKWRRDIIGAREELHYHVALPSHITMVLSRHTYIHIPHHHHYYLSIYYHDSDDHHTHNHFPCPKLRLYPPPSPSPFSTLNISVLRPNGLRRPFPSSFSFPTISPISFSRQAVIRAGRVVRASWTTWRSVEDSVIGGVDMDVDVDVRERIFL